MIRALVFPAAKNGFKSSFAVVCQEEMSVYIHLAINCNNPVRFLSDLIIIQSVWNDMKKLRRTKSRRTVSQDASRNLPANLQYF